MVKVKQAVSLLSPAKMKQLVSQIPWGLNIRILQKLQSNLPGEMKGKLPTATQLSNAIHQEMWMKNRSFY
jgi:hypothetical protein